MEEMKTETESKVRMILQDFRRRNDYPLTKAVPDMMALIQSEPRPPQLREVTDEPNFELILDMIKSDSVYTLLRFGTKCPSKSGIDECEDDAYYDLFELCKSLRHKEQMKGGTK